MGNRCWMYTLLMSEFVKEIICSRPQYFKALQTFILPSLPPTETKRHKLFHAMLHCEVCFIRSGLAQASPLQT